MFPLPSFAHQNGCANSPFPAGSRLIKYLNSRRDGARDWLALRRLSAGKPKAIDGLDQDRMDDRLVSKLHWAGLIYAVVIKSQMVWANDLVCDRACNPDRARTTAGAFGFGSCEDGHRVHRSLPPHVRPQHATNSYSSELFALVTIFILGLLSAIGPFAIVAALRGTRFCAFP